MRPKSKVRKTVATQVRNHLGAQRIKIDREEVVKLERAQLPKDLVHRGYREVTIQNILFKTDTVLYRLERLYSKIAGKLYEAELPVGVRGQSYGKELEAFAIMLYYELRVPQEKIVKKSQICLS